MAAGKNTDTVRRETAPGASVNAVDRRILSELSQDATLAYSELGRRVGLSAAAVHERTKRLRRRGVIQATEARLDGHAIGKPLLAFIHVDTTGWGKSAELMELAKLPEVEEIHSVTGDTCMLIKARVVDSRALEGLLARLYAMPTVRSTRTYVALSTYLERGPQAEVTVALMTDGDEQPSPGAKRGPA